MNWILVEIELHEMDNLTEKQIQLVIDWMNTWDQLRDTVIPIRFKDDFSDTNELNKWTKKITKDVNNHLQIIETQKHFGTRR